MTNEDLRLERPAPDAHEIEHDLDRRDVADALAEIDVDLAPRDPPIDWKAKYLDLLDDYERVRRRLNSFGG